MRCLLLVLLGATGAGCSGHYAMSMRGVHALAREGKAQEAHDALIEQTRGKGWDPLLVALDEGALLHRAGRWAESAQALNRAIAIANDRETVSVSEELFGRAPFRMANHEKQALHALQALNYLQLGEVDEALVEARLTDLRQGKLSRETERSRADERFVIGNTVDEAQRAFFEQLVFGRFISALAWEVGGRQEDAFLDYQRAWQLARSAPSDARVDARLIAPRLLRLANELGRPEAAALRAQAGMEPDRPLEGAGELVVVAESGFVPEVVLHEQQQGYGLVPLPRSTLPGYVVAGGAPHVPAPLSSLEELALRRQFSGIVVDRERSASVGVNTVMFLSYVVLFPIAMPLVIKRGYESSIRMGQSWLTLPAEFQISVIRLPAGAHTVRLPGPEGLYDRQVDIVAGRPTIVVTQAP